MTTPICDFVRKYASDNFARLHMPGHKGVSIIGCESMDITEFNGADELYMPNGIIAESEKNASAVFGSETFYSAGGSTLCIQSMLYLICLYSESKGIPKKIIAGRNAHKAFINAAALLDIEIEWIYPKGASYYGGEFSVDELEDIVKNRNAAAVYLTSPDYLGNISDIKKISDICKKNGIILAVDNAHGAYLKFLKKSMHPIDLGADICCDSAHKTLPVLTGGAYLHIGRNAPKLFSKTAKDAMALFGSSSPSYIILQSLDAFNKNHNQYKADLDNLISEIGNLKSILKNSGFKIVGSEPTKITINTKSIGYGGYEVSEILERKSIIAEFCDNDFVVLMFSPSNSVDDIRRVKNALTSIIKKEAIISSPPIVKNINAAVSPRKALFSKSEILPVSECLGRICAQTSLSCPPAVPIVICGEIIDKDIIKTFEYYNIDKCRVICNDKD